MVEAASSPRPADLLRRAAEAAGEGRPLDPDAAAWLRDGAARYLAAAPRGARLDDALGLVGPSGGTPWWEAERMAARDALLRELGATYAGGPYARARAAAADLGRYAAAGWPRDRGRGGPTPGDARRALMFRVLRLDPDPPLGPTRLAAIMAAAVEAPGEPWPAAGPRR